VKLPAPFIRTWGDIQRNFDALATAFTAALSGRNGVMGTVAVTTTASVTGSATVTHGLMVDGVATTPFGRPGDRPVGYERDHERDGGEPGPTQFTVGLRFTDGTARSTTHTISWQAWA
jgi:hypothetical protein